MYSQGTKLTWAQTGSKQVAVVGEDEKHAFTLVVSVANNGILFPFQSIHQGHTNQSLPKKTAPNYDDAIAKGFLFEYSGMHTYWSTLETMKSLVNNIVALYFECTKKELGLPPDQKSIWQIDVWVIHRSKEFRTWMKLNHETIIILYIPANCTGILQPCDVGIQCLLKHSFKLSYHQDLVIDVTEQSKSQSSIVIEKKLGIL